MAFKHIFAFVLMQMCACLKEHIRSWAWQRKCKPS